MGRIEIRSFMPDLNRLYDLEQTRPTVYLPFEMFPAFATLDVEDTGMIKLKCNISNDKSVEGKRFKSVKIKDINFIKESRVE